MKEKRFKEIVSEGIADLFYIWWQELKAVVKDQGVLIFFILVPLGYPLLYTERNRPRSTSSGSRQ